jgi:hypothetical protein
MLDTLSSGMGRKLKYPEKAVCAFKRGTFAAIEAVLDETEDRTDFVREAVAKELARREKGKKTDG